MQLVLAQLGCTWYRNNIVMALLAHAICICQKTSNKCHIELEAFIQLLSVRCNLKQTSSSNTWTVSRGITINIRKCWTILFCCMRKNFLHEIIEVSFFYQENIDITIVITHIAYFSNSMTLNCSQCCEEGGPVHGRRVGRQSRQSAGEPAGQWRYTNHNSDRKKINKQTWLSHAWLFYIILTNV